MIVIIALVVVLKGAAGTGDVVQAVTHVRTIAEDIESLKGMTEDALVRYAAKERLPVALVKEARDLGRLPVVNFAAGGVATPADAAMMMQLGCDGVFVGSVSPFTKCMRPKQEEVTSFSRLPRVYLSLAIQPSGRVPL